MFNDFSDMQNKVYKPKNNASVFSIFDNEKKILKESSDLSLQNSRKELKTNFISKSVLDNHIIQLCEEVNRRGREKKFGYFLTEAYFASLVIDEEEKLLHENEIKSYFITSLLEDYGSISNLMEACKGKSKLLDSKIEESKKCGKMLSDKCCKELTEGCKSESCKSEGCKSEACCKDGSGKDLSEFSVDDFLKQNDEEIDYDKVTINEIGEIVKEKVVQTVKDEQERQEKNKEFLEELKELKTVNESVNVYSKEQEQYSLYKSIMMKNYKCTIYNLKESVIPKDSVYGTLDENGNIDINMDYIMFDTLLEYTKLELMNTLKIENFNAENTRKLANKYAYINPAKVQ